MHFIALFKLSTRGHIQKNYLFELMKPFNIFIKVFF